MKSEDSYSGQRKSTGKKMPSQVRLMCAGRSARPSFLTLYSRSLQYSRAALQLSSALLSFACFFSDWPFRLWLTLLSYDRSYLLLGSSSRAFLSHSSAYSSLSKAFRQIAILQQGLMNLGFSLIACLQSSIPDPKFPKLICTCALLLYSLLFSSGSSHLAQIPSVQFLSADFMQQWTPGCCLMSQLPLALKCWARESESQSQMMCWRATRCSFLEGSSGSWCMKRGWLSRYWVVSQTCWEVRQVWGLQSSGISNIIHSVCLSSLSLVVLEPVLGDPLAQLLRLPLLGALHAPLVHLLQLLALHLLLLILLRLTLYALHHRTRCQEKTLYLHTYAIHVQHHLLHQRRHRLVVLRLDLRLKFEQRNRQKLLLESDTLLGRTNFSQSSEHAVHVEPDFLFVLEAEIRLNQRPHSLDVGIKSRATVLCQTEQKHCPLRLQLQGSRVQYDILHSSEESEVHRQRGKLVLVEVFCGVSYVYVDVECEGLKQGVDDGGEVVREVISEDLAQLDVELEDGGVEGVVDLGD